jgi:KaiC/GvpD/RAD55 family RecA-like ATPase
LKEGPKFPEKIGDIILRKELVNQVRNLIAPTATPRLYPLIIGEHGTGKTSLIQFAVNGLEEPKGIVYVDVPVEDESPVDLAQAMQQALGWNPDLVIDSNKRN